MDQVLQVAIAFRDCGDLMGFRKYFALWIVEGDALRLSKGRLNTQAQREVKQRLKEIDMPEIMEWFKQEGIAEGMERGIEQGMERGIEQGMERGIEQGMERGARAKAVEDARKMREHGIEWRVVTDVTGIKPDDAGIQ